MKIMFLIRGLDKGGAERQLSYLAKGINDCGHQVVVVTYYDNKDDNPNVIYLLGGNVKLISLRKKSRYDNCGFFYRLLKIIKTENPNVVYSFLELSNVFAALAKLILFSKSLFIWGKRSSDLELGKYTWSLRIEHYVEKCLSVVPSVIISNSYSGKRYMEQLGYKAKIDVVHNGIDWQLYPKRQVVNGRIVLNKIPVTDFIFLAVGRHDKAKDYDILVQAFVNAFRYIKNAKLVIVGRILDFFEYEKLTSIVSANNLQEQVYFINEVDNVLPYYYDANVLVSSSYTEGFSNVISEAMLCQLPIITTDAGDSKFIVGECGVVIKRRSIPHLSEAMLSYYYLPQAVLAEIGVHARNRIINNFSVRNLTENTLEVINNELA